MESAVIERVNGHILRKVHPLSARISITAIISRIPVLRPIRRARTQPALITQGNKMSRVQRLDVGRSLGSPVVDDRSVAAVAARLVHELPGEDGVGVLVAVHDELDVVLVGSLSGGVCVEGRGIASKHSTVGVDAAEVVPVVEEVQDL